MWKEASGQGGGEAGGELVGGGKAEVVGGDADGGDEIRQGVFDDDAVAGFAEEKADGFAVGGGGAGRAARRPPGKTGTQGGVSK